MERHSSKATVAVVVCLVLILVGLGACRELRAEEPLQSPTSSALSQLKTEYPGARYEGAGDRRTVYGVPMVGSADPDEAAREWIQNYGVILGRGVGSWHQTRSFAVSFGKFMVYHYEQRYQGVPVEESAARVLVLAPGDDTDGPWRVVFASAARFEERLPTPLPATLITEAGALEIVRAQKDYLDLNQWTRGELVLTRPTSSDTETAGMVRCCWKLSGFNSDRSRMRGLTFFVDSNSGELIRVRNDVYTLDVDGSVAGMLTPGLDPDIPGNEPVEGPLPFAEVSDGTTTVAADGVGDYLVTGLPGTAVTIETRLVSEFINVIAAQGVDEVLSALVTPPDTLDFLFNSAEDEFTTSQVNVLLHGHATHDFFSSRVPDYEGLDKSLDCFVNIDDTCNAFYYSAGGGSLNFFNAGTFDTGTEILDCVNSAYSSVIAHEYGHFIVNSLGLAQGAFGEGFSDCVSMLQYDDPIIAREFFGPSDPIRDIVAADQQYPCVDAIHTCGQVLGGVWWDLKLELELLGASGLEDTRQLFVDWAVVTLGGSGGDAATPQTAIEVLVVDDDDGVISNGTPHRAAICDAFDAHSISCPALDPIELVFDQGIPTILESDGSTVFPMRVEGISGTPEDLTGKLHYSTNGGAFVTVDLDSTGTDEYDVEIPVLACGDVVDFYLSAEDSLAIQVNSPVDAPTSVHRAVVTTGLTLILDDDFETDMGWTVGDADVPDDATTGIWERVAPIGTAAQVVLDRTPGAGSQCFVTGQGSVNGDLGENDIDVGKTTLLSPLLDLSESGEYFISYWRSFSNNVGNSPTDVFEVEISDDDGATWADVETVGPSGVEATKGWFFHRFKVDDFVVPSAEVRIRFIAADLSFPSIVEAAIDDVRVEHYSCATCVVPAVSSQPLSQTLCEGDALDLAVIASGTGPLTYQWRHDGVDLVGETSDTLSIASMGLADAGDYEVVVTNSCGSDTSQTATVGVDEEPVVTQQPLSETVCDTDSVTLSIVAMGSAPLSYQWRKDGVDLAGQTDSDLVISTVLATDAGDYDCVVVNHCALTTSSVAVLTVEENPQLTTEPIGQSLCIGDDVTLSAAATGNPLPTYQWRKDGVDLAGETGATLTITDLIVEDAADYQVVAANVCGSVTSSVATLVVGMTPAITIEPDSQEVCTDDAATLTVVASGSLPLSYQWRRDGVDVPGATAASFTMDPVQLADAGDYTVVVTNSCGAATSLAAVLSVDEAPTITEDPADMTACEGDDVVLTVVASGTAPLSYQWRKGGVDLAGEDSDSLILSDVTALDATDYSVAVTNTCDTTISAVGILTVETPPMVVTQPLAATACLGDAVTLTVVGGGTAPLNHQWRLDGADLVGETAASLVLDPVALEDAGDYTVVLTNDCGTATSTAATVTVEQPPSITQDPMSATECQGAMVTLTVVAAGSPPLSFQWKKDGVDLSGATGDELVVDPLEPGDDGDYTVLVTNSCGSELSGSATLTVDTPPTVTTDPVGADVCVGDDVELTVVAAGTPELTYQWRLDGVDVAGANESTLSLTEIDTDDSGDYTVLVTNACGSAVSAVAVLTVDVPPSVSEDPIGVTACEGDDVVLSVTATGTAPLAFQWSKDGVDVAGATNSTLTLTDLTTSDADDYRVVVTNDCGSTESAIATVAVEVAPAITMEPQVAIACVGDEVTFSVVAEGSAPLTYQWRIDGVDLIGENDDNLILDSAQLNDAGDYSVLVTNNCGTIVSADAELTVEEPASITTDPEGVTGCAGDSVSLTVVAAGTPPLSYQWRLDGVDLDGQTASTLTFDPVVAEDVGNYSVRVTNSCGSATSVDAALEVLAAPMVNAEPVDAVICEGDPVSFTVEAAGSAPLSYQWRRNGIDIADETDDSLSIDAAVPADAAEYEVVITNECGTVTSAATTLTVEVAPEVVEDPQAQVVCVGDEVTFEVVVSGTEPLSYQWRRNGEELADETTSALNIGAVSSDEAGDFDVVVTNDCGSVTSAAALLTVESPPVIEDVSAVRFKGEALTVEYEADVSGSEPLTYDWDFGDGSESVEVSPTHGYGVGDFYDVTLTVSNDCGSDSFTIEVDLETTRFRRGDVDGSGSVVVLTDALYLLNYAYGDGEDPPCFDAADIDGDNVLSPLVDTFFLLHYGFNEGDSPSDPGADACGPDPDGDDDGIGCDTAAEICQ